MSKRTLRAGLLALISSSMMGAVAQNATLTAEAPTLTFAQTEHTVKLHAAYRAALDNLLTINTVSYATGNKEKEYDQTGLLAKAPATFVRAGGAYEQPWTRDASVNSWNAGSLLEPAVAQNTLYSVLRRQPDGKLIVQQDNQWWDQTIWITAAWNHFLVTGDRAFLTNAYEAARQTLEAEHQKHFNAAFGLYQGPAFLNDGIAGYPAPPADVTESRGSFVLDYPGAASIMVLSTNCLYTQAYQVAAMMAVELGRPASEAAALRTTGETLAQHIREHFWIPGENRFGYLLDPSGKLDPSQEGAGLAYSILFGVATPEQAAAILKTIHINAHGLVDVYPPFPRFGTEHPGRHNEIVWPPIESFWAEAAARSGDIAAFAHETENLAELVDQNGGHFWEIYNAQTGKPDGGWQVRHQWDSQPDQTWSATGYLRMIYAGLFGMRFQVNKLAFAPSLPAGWGDVTLSGLHYRKATLTVTLHGQGQSVRSVKLDGKSVSSPEISAALTGTHTLEMELGG